MELNAMIKELVESGILENQELAVTLLTSDQIEPKEKRKHIQKFVDDFMSGKVTFEDPKQKHIFEGWVKIYQDNLADDVKTRVKRIE